MKDLIRCILWYEALFVTLNADLKNSELNFWLAEKIQVDVSTFLGHELAFIPN